MRPCCNQCSKIFDNTEALCAHKRFECFPDFNNLQKKQTVSLKIPQYSVLGVVSFWGVYL